ncbi:hypothetical protein [Actinosynnema sp. ALI-1.44]|uniref:hypothetical protein n=1 Tax=Actinosynnema sp. ALI-1.44 TaxID=1933779 RepID=UPI00143D11C2|nr:hypothetical protein [Actinosynnema sp. ALI-1.44]
MCVIVLIFAVGAALLAVGIVQGQTEITIIGGVLIVFLFWALLTDNTGSGDADDSEA